MVMHRALFTWFILLLFFILLCLRLDGRMHWNWFLIFLPMWLYDVILSIIVLFNLAIYCKQESTKELIRNEHNLLLLMVILKVAAQIMICLKLEYKSLHLTLYHVLIPLWLLLPILIVDVSFKLYKSSYTF